MKPTVLKSAKWALGLTVFALAVVATANTNPKTLKLDALVNLYEPVLFDHQGHSEMGFECSTCHHKPKGKPLACSTCHKGSVSKTRPHGLGLKGALHRQCMSCHKESGAPVGCTDCHKRKKKIQ